MSDATITLRKATPKDAADLAIIDNMASHGMSLQFWQHAVIEGEAEDPLVFARERFADPQSPFGWANAMVAQSQSGELLGALTAYVMPAPDDEVDEIKRLFPEFAPVFELFGYAVGDWFIDSLGIFPQGRGRGVARTLVQRALENGRLQGMKHAALVVESENQTAFRLYEALGFESVRSLPMVGKQSQGEWLLMKRSL